MEKVLGPSVKISIATQDWKCVLKLKINDVETSFLTRQSILGSDSMESALSHPEGSGTVHIGLLKWLQWNKES